MKVNLTRRLAAEFLGTAFLLAAVVGSGIMAERLAAGNTAIALLANTAATSAALFALILSFAGVSGAHFNPAITITQLLTGNMKIGNAAAYLVAQMSGAIAGVGLANLMFGLPVFFISQKPRTGPAQWLSEAVATFGLIIVITATARLNSKLAVPLAVASFIAAAYWFTASTSFANPAVTLARCLSDTFAGIRPTDIPGFVGAQMIGAITATYVGRWLFSQNENDEQ